MDNNTTQISDELNENREIYNFKEITLFSTVKGYLDLNRGKLYTEVKSLNAENYALPLYIGLTYNPENSTGHYGSGWRISLDKKLLISQKDTAQTTVYTYVDEAGNPHTLDEKYYVTEGAGKTFVSKEMLTVDINGNLTYNGKPVYKHQSYADYTLIPEINDFKGYELIEQRAEEQIGLEEYILQAEKQLRSYVRVNKANGAPSGNNVDFTASGNFTKEKYEAFLDGVTINSDDVIITESERLKWADLSETDRQILINGAAANLDSIKYEYIKCFRKKAELERLVKNTPVRFLKDGGGIIEGFNAEGDLVLIADSYGNYLSIERGADGRIFNVFDSKKSVVKFGYVGGLLKSITDNRGRKVEYAYDSSNRLTKITYADGEVCNFTYNANNEIATVKPSSGETCEFTYLNSKISRLTTKKFDETISDLQIAFNTDNSVTLTNENGEYEKYTYNTESKLTEYKTKDELNREITRAYTYSNGGKTVTVVTTKNYEYSGNRKVTETKEYDDFGLLKKENVGLHWIAENTEEESYTNYYYDNDNRLIEKKTTRQRTYYFYSDEDDTYSTCSNELTEKYSYDNHGKLTLTESYEGSGTNTGINFEERVYNDSGDMVKCIRWNSLDSSSKFYEEYEREEDGTVRYERDETGAYSALYEYVDGTGLVNAVTYANGGKLAYGRNPLNDKITAITQSTAEGEANTNEIRYYGDKPTSYNDGNVKIGYNVDCKGRKIGLYVDGKKQWTCTYNDTRGYNSDKTKYNLVTQTKTLETGSGNISVVSERCRKYTSTLCEELTVDGTLLNRVTYNGNDSLSSRFYLAEGNQYRYCNYSYDEYGKLTSVVNGVQYTNERILSEEYEYDDDGVLWKRKLTGAVNQTYTYSCGRHWEPYLNYIIFENYRFAPLTDVYGRNTGKEISNGSNKIAGEYISYRKVGDHATNMPASIWFASGGRRTENIKYKYDSCGNICEITQNGHLVARYTYDSLNRLVREDNKPLNRTTIVVYDDSGNVVDRCYYSFTEYNVEPHAENSANHERYEYEGNKLVRSVSSAVALYEYNNLGNPTKYRGKTLTWKYGKWLTKYDTTTFEYDGLGRRTKKSKDGTNITFVYDSADRLIKQGSVFEFIYDKDGIVGFKYSNGMYFYRRDAQGNIIAILNSSGEVVSTYTYDAWGGHEVGGSNKSLGNLNPFRYRGYYYDTETGLYYLQTRYYDPGTGRFISQDNADYADPETINGLNLYAYCLNNPVMNVDPTGTSLIAFILVLVAATAIGATVKGVVAYQNGARGSELFGEILKGVAIGLAVGAAAVTLVGVVGGAILGVSATILGASAKAIFVVGAVAFNIDAYVLAPILGFEMEGIDFETPTPVDLPTKPQPTPPHPGMKSRGKVGLSINIVSKYYFNYYNINRGKIIDYIQW